MGSVVVVTVVSFVEDSVHDAAGRPWRLGEEMEGFWRTARGAIMER
jgi:hypothetical protein